MDDNGKIDPAILIAQYRETYAHYLHNSRFMWQVYSLTIVISGGLIIASFAYVGGKELWWVRDIVLLIAGIITTSLLIAVKKYRYFAEVAAATLSRLEDTLGTKRVQRTTEIKDDAPKKDNSEPKRGDYWNVERPEDKDNMLERFFARKSADRWLGYSMYALVVIIIICIIFNTVLGLLDCKQILQLPNLLTAFIITIIFFAIAAPAFYKLIQKV